ncbi:Uma2 family endonuclease [Streptomyces sp. NPDC050485]|uniref:Uma2 family endonuclease n=1 Tax=Streptomyces sp. NPDC050485 TaxID=3365617 RepID=UPI0037ACB1A3
MTAEVVEGGSQWGRLLKAWQDMDVPDGWRAEIDEGRIIVVPPPSSGHNLIADLVSQWLYRCLPDGYGLYQTLGVHIASLGKLYVPDLVVFERAELAQRAADAGEDPLPVDGADTLLVVEIASKSNAKDDRTKKLWAYAHAPVPAYLLIDRFDARGPMATLFTEPEGGVYKHDDPVPFGRTVAFPEPFLSALDTGGFPR